ncbi:MAG: ATP-binding protein [Clostridia bacterium]|nr:ATP-binding protein [Clostridia bacterium]
MHNYENYNKVREMIDDRRAKARRLSDSRTLEMRSLSPEIARIDEELEKTGPLIFKTAVSGGDIAPLRLRNQELVARRRAIIKSLGYPEDYTDVKYYCPTCKDTGFLENTKACSCFRRLLYSENIKSSGMGNLIDKQSFENFDISVYAYDEEVLNKMENVLSVAKEFAYNFSKNRGKNLLLMGRTGTGKTHISTSIAKVLLEGGYYVLYDSAQNIISAFENDRFKSGFGPYEPTADKYLECDLLIIDDLGAEFVNQFSVSCLYNILNTRRNRGLPTIISTNLTASDLSSKYEDRIYSRIVGSDYKVLFFYGKDYRFFGRR